MLFINLALLVADMSVILAVSVVYMAFPWANLISPIIPIAMTLLSIVVVLVTSTKHTKIKSMAIILVAQVVGLVLSLIISYGLNLLIGRFGGVDYIAAYYGINSIANMIHAVFSIITGFLTVFALGRYFDLQDYADLLDE